MPLPRAFEQRLAETPAFPVLVGPLSLHPIDTAAIAGILRATPELHGSRTYLALAAADRSTIAALLDRCLPVFPDPRHV